MTKNVTLSADAELIERARARARAQRTSLNDAFRAWLRRYVGEEGGRDAYTRLMERLEGVSAGGHFDRDELNAR